MNLIFQSCRETFQEKDHFEAARGKQNQMLSMKKTLTSQQVPLEVILFFFSLFYLIYI